MNSAARLVTNSSGICHVSPILDRLNWLPISCRIDMQILALIFKCFHGTAPVYLSEKLTRVNQIPERSGLPSFNTTDLLVQRARLKTFGERRFSICGPRSWNKLDLTVRSSQSLRRFKSLVKEQFLSDCF